MKSLGKTSRNACAAFPSAHVIFDPTDTATSISSRQKTTRLRSRRLKTLPIGNHRLKASLPRRYIRYENNNKRQYKLTGNCFLLPLTSRDSFLNSHALTTLIQVVVLAVSECSVSEIIVLVCLFIEEKLINNDGRANQWCSQSC